MMLRWLIINQYRPGAIELPREMDAGPTVPRGRYQILQQAVEHIDTYRINNEDMTATRYEWVDVFVETREGA